MTGAQWAILVPALVSLAGAAAAWFRAQAAHNRIDQTNAKVSNVPSDPAARELIARCARSVAKDFLAEQADPAAPAALPTPPVPPAA